MSLNTFVGECVAIEYVFVCICACNVLQPVITLELVLEETGGNFPWGTLFVSSISLRGLHAL